MKDLFSDCSALYQQTRPSYPNSVMTEILKYVPSTHFAWDCGAGSGQFTQLLVPYFEYIVATDLSIQQLHQAPYFENVSYQVQPAEQTSFADQSFDLIVVAQAIHWFDFDAFYPEVKRTLKKDGVIAVVGYGTLSVKDQGLNQLIQHLYTDILKDDWDVERRHIDAQYQSIPFPFEKLADSNLNMQFSWSKQQLLGYLNTWSAIKRYRERHADQNASEDGELSNDPLKAITEYLQELDQKKDQSIEVDFPIFMKIGRVNKQTIQNHSNHEKAQILNLFNMRQLMFGCI